MKNKLNQILESLNSEINESLNPNTKYVRLDWDGNVVQEFETWQQMNSTMLSPNLTASDFRKVVDGRLVELSNDDVYHDPPLGMY